MIGIDTNVLLRLATGDDAKQLKAVTHWLAEHGGEGNLYINHVVLAEALWSLKSAYDYTRPQLATFIESLLGNAAFNLEEPGMVEDALQMYLAGKADFPDCLIFAKNARLCTATLSFDKATRELPGTIML